MVDNLEISPDATEFFYFFDQTLEIAISWDFLNLKPGQFLQFKMKLMQNNDTLVEYHPVNSLIKVQMPDKNLEGKNWII